MRQRLTVFTTLATLLLSLSLLNLSQSAFSQNGQTELLAENPASTKANTCASSPLRAYTGTYQGEITYNDEPTKFAVTSELFLNEECKLSGRYTYDEGSEKVSGTFFPVEVSKDRTLSADWNDRYGKGKLKAGFSENYRSFKATWGVDSSDNSEGGWSGQR